MERGDRKKTKQSNQVFVHDGVAGAVPIVPVSEGGAGPGPRHQGAAPPPPQADGGLQEAAWALHHQGVGFRGAEVGRPPGRGDQGGKGGRLAVIPQRQRGQDLDGV